MLDQILGFLAPILNFLGQQYGVIGTVGGYLFFVVAPILSIVIELAEMVAILSVSPKDDVVVAKVKAIWTGKILPWLEIIPHVNIPIGANLAKVILYMTKGKAVALAAVKAWKES